MSTQTFQPEPNLLDAEQVCYQYEGTNIFGASLVNQYIYVVTPEQAEAILTRVRIDVDVITPRREALRRRKKRLTREELGTFSIQLAETNLKLQIPFRKLFRILLVPPTIRCYA